MRKIYTTRRKLLPGPLSSRAGRIASAAQISATRREDREYPLALRLRYRVYRGENLVSAGEGQTVAISLKSVLFTGRLESLERGLSAELFIDWPALRDNQSPIQLYIAGQVASSAGDRVLVRTRFQDFRVGRGHCAYARS